MSTALVIGAKGAIGNAIVRELCHQEAHQRVIAIARESVSFEHAHIESYKIDTHTEDTIKQCCKDLNLNESAPALVICCIGVLHDTSSQLFPEKSLTQFAPEHLHHYFHVNTIIPMLWLKYLSQGLVKMSKTQFVFLSARIGSITDNKLGGWYGYRASKAALNMALKTAQIELNRRYPHVSCISYHPGTVDSALSAPFKSNIPDSACFSAEFTASQLLSILPVLQPSDAPHYIDWQGKPIPW